MTRQITPTPKSHRGLFSILLPAFAVGVLVVLANPIFAQETNINTNASTNTVVDTPASSQTTSPVDTSDLEAQIREKQAKIDELERQQRVYEANVSQKEQEALSLQNQIGILDNQIAKTDVDTKKLALQIESLSLEIEELSGKVQAKETEIKQHKDRMAELLRILNRYDRKSTLEITLTNETLSQFFHQLQYLQTIEEEAKTSLEKVQALKGDLEAEKTAREEKKTSSEEKKHQLDTEKNNLESQQSYREELLSDTKQSEKQFEALLNQSKQEQLSANTDIQTFEAQIRQRLEGENKLPEGPTALIWPVPSRRVTSYFHDPAYIFRRYFEHPAIDVATPQGTAIRAAASGFVARAKNAGLGYSYIMLVHGNDLSTVYGHVSQISVVEDDFVVQGQVIGYSGGTPGTPGAGRLTTGAHLHFEVRVGGIPSNPLNYLP